MVFKEKHSCLFKFSMVLVCLNVFSQNEFYKSDFNSAQILDSILSVNDKVFWDNLKNQSTNLSAFPLIENQLLISDKKELNPLDIEKKQDTVNKMLLKTKMNAERWRCTYPDPKKIATQKAAKEKFKN